MFDLAIIGGGPGGYVAAERAGAKGLSVVLFEKNELGGVCLNEGCIPTKTLLYSAKVYDYARHADLYGVSVEGASFDFRKIIIELSDYLFNKFNTFKPPVSEKFGIK